MKKILAIVACMAFVFSGVAMASVPAPPVNQVIGFPDTEFNEYNAAECRVCHADAVNDHHLLYGDVMPSGVCSTTTGTCNETTTVDCVGDGDCPAGESCVAGTPGACVTNEDCATPLNLCNVYGDVCPVGVCEDNATACTIDADCDGIGGGTCDAPACPRSYSGQTCGQPFCYGESAAPVPNASPGVYSCLSCHEQETVGGVTNFLVERDCLNCHIQNPNTATVHHDESGWTAAKDGFCTPCHGDIVDDKDDGHYIPTYAPSIVTPYPSHHEDPVPQGGCNYCHDAGTDASTGIHVVDNHDTHHHAGIHKLETGGSDRDKCAWCHQAGRPGNGPAETEIRTCENCHGPESLHNIQADSDNNGIVIGGELYGYGHVGIDDPAGDSDCMGCHNNGVASASAPYSGPIAPTLTGANKTSVMKGAVTALILTGSGLTNTNGGVLLESEIVVEFPNGTSGTYQTYTLTSNSAIIMLTGWEPVGRLVIRAVKNGQASNPIVVDVTPRQAIIETMCEACTGVITITGVGFGDAPPAGAEEFLNVEIDGVSMEIISWSDTEIQIQGSCDYDALVVNTIFGAIQ